MATGAKWALTFAGRALLALAAGRVGLLLGDDGLGALLRVRDNVKSRGLDLKKKKKEIER